MKSPYWVLAVAISLVAPTTTRAATPTASIAEELIAEATRTMVVDPNHAGELAHRAEMSASSISDSRRRQLVIAAARRLLAECALRSDDLDGAQDEIEKSIRIISVLDGNSKLMADALLTRGGVNASQSQVASALADYQSAFKLFAHVGDKRSEAVALTLISSLYNEAKDNNSALKYLTQAAELKQNDVRLAIMIANNRGTALQDLGRYAEAETVFMQAMELSKQDEGNFIRVQVMSNIARNRLAAGELDSAEITIAKAMSLIRSGAASAWRPQLLAIAAEAALRRHRTALAGRLIEQSFDGVDLKTTTMSNRSAHSTAYRTFTALHRPAEALAHLVALKRLDDEATKLATNTSTALMGARFDFANQELRIARLRAEDLRRSVVIEQDKARFERLIFMIVAGATAAIIALLAWLLFTIRRSRDTVRAANDGLAITNAALGKALAAKTEFLATTSHEIRTPLNGILGMTQVMLADRALAPDLRDRLGIVHTAGTTMRTLVDDILDVAKMETGNLSVEQAPFDLSATLRAATLLWEAQCQAKGLAFHARLDDCPDTVVGDAARVRQIVFNLLVNAVKFTEQGSVTLAVSAGREAGTISIAVTDTGIGIALAQQAAIFEAFRQADTSTTRRFGGTGLGLSISRSLAEAMNGEVRVESVPGEGATFVLTLPLVEQQADHRGDISIPDPVAPPCDLMVLDRSPIGQALWRSLLAPHVDDLAFVGDTDEALAAIRAGGARRLLVDDATIGGELATACRIAEAARTADIAMVLLWPQGREDEHAALRRAGVDRIVARPFAAAALIDAVALRAGVLVPEAA